MKRLYNFRGRNTAAAVSSSSSSGKAFQGHSYANHHHRRRHRILSTTSSPNSNNNNNNNINNNNNNNNNKGLQSLHYQKSGYPFVTTATAATATAGATGFILHHHYHHQKQKQKQEKFRLYASSSSSSDTEEKEKNNDEVITPETILQQAKEEILSNHNENNSKDNDNHDDATTPKGIIFDITHRWENATDDHNPTDFFATIFPQMSNNTTNTTKCESSSSDPNSNSNNLSSFFKKNQTKQSEQEQQEKEQQDNNEEGFFSRFQNAVQDVMDDFVTPNSSSTPGAFQNSKTNSANTMDDATDLGKSFLSLLTGGSGGSKNNNSGSDSATAAGGGTNTVEDIVAKARSMSEKGDVADKASLTELLQVSQRAAEELEEQFEELLGVDGHTKLPPLHPSNLFYFLEYEDEVKNPSYRRRKHRFFPGVDMNELNDLNSKLQLALLSYQDTLEDIQEGLSSRQYELVYCSMESSPGKPSHFIAISKELSSSSSWSSPNTLDILFVVRGTKTITDVITDLLCDATEYDNGGYAHKGMMESGKYLATKHDALFQQLLKLSGKKRINLTMIGHSLGAGAACIAGMEMNKKDHLDVKVYGFGCPAVISKELSENASDFITTVVADNDLVPRMSTATMINAIMDAGTFNWIPYARRDLQETAKELQRRLPMLFTNTTLEKLLNILDDFLPNESDIPKRPSNFQQRMEPILFPPGRIYHFYRDGFGISGNVVPCTFFNELDMSRRMIHDHLLFHGYQRIFLEIMRERQQDHHFRFDDDNEDGDGDNNNDNIPKNASDKKKLKGLDW